MEGLLASAGFECRAFATAEDFLEGIGSDGAAGCMILDVSLPGMNGLDFQRKLGMAGLSIPIIFLTGHGDIPMTVSAMKSGAIEFFTKPFDDERLLEAVRHALARDRTLHEQSAEMATLRSRLLLLTRRERQVMDLVLAGQLNKEIAAQLGTSVITIKVHRSQVMHKMEAHSLLELAKMAEKLRQATKQD
jgi:FixJ family two-component response regulator